MFMKYLKKRFWILFICFILFSLACISMLKTRGTGYRPSITGGGAGPLSWREIFHSYKSIILASVLFTSLFTYFDYWDYKKK